MADVFISYARDNAETARRFAEGLEAAGFKVWWDDALRSGDVFDEKIEQALRSAKAVVVLWSKSSVVSRWVRAEATLADRNKTLAPVMIQPCERPIIFELTQTADLTHWKGDDNDKAWLSFVADVQKLVAVKKRKPKPRPAVAPPEAPAPQTFAAAATAAPAVPTGQRGQRTSIAIMPFVNRSGEREDDVFADGMVEDIISALSLSRTARVIASSATRSFRDNATDMRLIGRELGARYILEGNIRRVGADLRVTAQLVEAETGAILWTQKFDRPLAELAHLQEDLITEVAGQIGVQVGRLDMERALKKPGDLTAWEALMRSFSAYGRLGLNTIPTAVAEARRAVEIDPSYATAHGCLALGLATQFLWTGYQDEAVRREAKMHADRAMELGSNDFNALWTTCWALTCIFESAEAVRLGERAVEINPNNANSRNALAQALMVNDELERALPHMDEADRLAPRGFNYYLSLTNRAMVLLRLGRYTEALEAADRALALSPNYAVASASRGLVLAKLGRDEEARANMVRHRRAHPYLTRDMLLQLTRGGSWGHMQAEVLEISLRLFDETEAEISGSP